MPPSGLTLTFVRACVQVRAWQEGVKQEARDDDGSHRVRTMMGRHRSLPGFGEKPNSPHYRKAERAAINTPVQGSAADVVAAAMLRIHLDPGFKRLGWRMLLQVHDEVRPALPRPVPEPEAQSETTSRHGVVVAATGADVADLELWWLSRHVFSVQTLLQHCDCHRIPSQCLRTESPRGRTKIVSTLPSLPAAKV